MQARLTDKAVERYAPKSSRYEVHDTYLTGLSLRVTEKGRKSWYVTTGSPAPGRVASGAS